MPTRRLWRAPLAWAEPQTRKYICGVLWLLQAAKCIEQVGDDPAWTTLHSQALLANMKGVARSTMNRLINKVTAPDGRWDKPCASEKHTHAAGAITRRECWSQRKRVKAQEKGLQVHEHEINSVDRLLTLFHKSQGGFGIVKMYNLAMAAALRPKLKTRSSEFEDAENLAAAFNPICEACQGKDDKCEKCGGSGYAKILFDPKARSFTEASFNGHNDCDMQFYSAKMPDANPCECSLGQENLPFVSDCEHCGGKGYVIGRRFNRKTGQWEWAGLDDITRDVATYLQLKGIKDFPYMQLIQAHMARELGIDPNTWYRSRQKLEWLGYLKVVDGAILRECSHCAHTWWDERSKADPVTGLRKEEFCPRGCRDKDGPVKGSVLKRKPDKLIWLPNVLLDPDVLARERERFLDYQRQLKNDREAMLANDVWVKLHDEWSGQQHNLEAFWTELRRRLIAAGLNKSAIDALLPIYRE